MMRLRLCCDVATRFITLRYDNLYAFSERDAYLSFVRTTPPRWAMFANHFEDEAYQVSTERVWVTYCPFCGATLPPPQLRDKSIWKPIMVIVDGGYYCDTCDERLDACHCRRPESLWMPPTT